MDQVKGRSYTREIAGKEQAKPRRAGKPWLRLLSKLLLVPFLLFFSLVIGLIIGYSVIGKLPVAEVFDFNTYKHMYDLIFSGT
ncbi:DNA-directed RNA polymerase subunit beta [Brevibacillus sp. SYP-B805]|uniref:DNA-directed RNA polymerase subunit beta n=1 Tax=Brevibacillus sp. SYP-B805 TaxID=1578199 RepID=UPI0013EB286C|nr:DNA-directed RNA polymerase subunit beta [Brevibacillus sp. SYP-B805]NGQ95585.1 DNA-directed RNA polymerase subunit beta [Brevibacillus sp. SYP-B805]